MAEAFAHGNVWWLAVRERLAGVRAIQLKHFSKQIPESPGLRPEP